jgi:hypothetical protein
MKTDNALQRLQAQPITLRGRLLSRPIDPQVELRTFIRTASSLSAISRTFRPADEQELNTLRNRCRLVDYDLSQFSKREIRMLSRDESTVLSASFLKSGLASVLQNNVKLRVEPLITIYFNHWRTMDDAQAIERLITLLLHKFPSANPLMQRYRQESNQLFSSSADTFLARESLNRREQISLALDRRSIGMTTRLGHAANAAAINEWLRDLKSARQESDAIASIQFLVDKLLTSSALDPSSLHTAVAAAALSPWSDRSESFRSQLLSFVMHDRRLGDPRLPKNAPNWASVAQMASQKVRSWLAQRDIVFFFDFVLPDRRDEHRRKDFWLQYVDKVLESQVALCPEDRFRLKAEVKEQMAYTNIRDNKVSAFLMRFSGHPDIVAVEFSQSGNAVYFYDANIFRTAVGSFQQLSFRVTELKHHSHIEKFTHYPPGVWQQRVRSFLASRGIRLG